MSDPIMIGGTVTSRVAAQLREDIFSKRIEAGSHISIQEIADKYGISKTPVREAFRTLEGERLLKFNAYKGATVLAIDRTYICEVYGLLRVLECYLYETAFPHITEEDLAHMKSINAEIRGILDGNVNADKYVGLDVRFHSIVLNRATNLTARELYDTYRKTTRALRGSYVPWMDRICVVAEEHQQLIDAFEKQDVAALKDSLGNHVMHAMENFLKQYDMDN